MYLNSYSANCEIIPQATILFQKIDLPKLTNLRMKADRKPNEANQKQSESIFNNFLLRCTPNTLK